MGTATMCDGCGQMKDDVKQIVVNGKTYSACSDCARNAHIIFR